MAQKAKGGEAVITRRANRFYIYTGPANLVKPATDDEVRAALRDMTERKHVNQQVVKDELKDRERRTCAHPLTRIELLFLQHGAYQEDIATFIKRHGVTREYRVAEEANT